MIATFLINQFLMLCVLLWIAVDIHYVASEVHKAKHEHERNQQRKQQHKGE